MDTHSAETAIRRAAKAFRHASQALASAQTDRAKARHARRVRNAQRAMGDARWTFEHMTCEGAD